MPDGTALLQLEASYEFKRVMRDTPRAVVYDAAALGAPELRSTNPISGSHASVDLTLHPVRYAVDLSRSVEEGGVRKLQRSAA